MFLAPKNNTNTEMNRNRSSAAIRAVMGDGRESCDFRPAGAAGTTITYSLN
jgi:hypothetical protein